MKCTSLLLSFMAGLLLYAYPVAAKSQQPITNKAAPGLSFLENKGQIINQDQVFRKDIDFRLSAGGGLNLFIGSGKIEYQWAKTKQPAGQPAVVQEAMLSATVEESGYELYRMDVTLIGANAQATLISELQQPYYERYYLPGMPETGALAHSYRKITYQNIYPHIDWVFYFNSKGQLEHDFVVKPGGKVSDIKIRYGGATDLQLLADGSLQAHSPMGSIKEKAPYSYEEQGRAVASHFVLEGNVLSFAVEEYSGMLTIDPTLEWGTYFGGLAYDVAYAVACDAQNNVYIGGGTGSVDRIATTGSYQATYGGPAISMGDAFVAKYNANGGLLWSTYYGGDKEDRGMDVCFDTTRQHLYLAGFTKSTSSIATASTHQPIFGGNVDAFIVKLDTSGQRIWATYFGGIGADGNTSLGINCDRSGNVFLCGSTQSDNGMSTSGIYQPLRAGNTDAFLAKFDRTGQRLWGSYYCGPGIDLPRRLACDKNGLVYMTGQTASDKGIASSNGYQATFGGNQDAFLACFQSGGQISWSTYLGGDNVETGNALAVDDESQVYLTGATFSKNGIATDNSYQDTFGGGSQDVFLVKYGGNGQLLWASYYGGEGAEAGFGVAVSSRKEIYLTGQSNSNRAMGSPGSFLDSGNASYQVFLAQFTSEGLRSWGSYYGGVGGDAANGLCLDNAYHIYVTGQTHSATNISTNGAQQADFGGGNNDAILAQWNICMSPQNAPIITGDTVVCEGVEQLYQIAHPDRSVSYSWQLPLGWQGASDSTQIYITPLENSGTLSVVASNYCAIGDTISLQISVVKAPNPKIEINGAVLSTEKPYARYQWLLENKDILGATLSTFIPEKKGSYSVRVYDSVGCEGISGSIVIENTAVVDKAQEYNVNQIFPNPAFDYLYLRSNHEVMVKIVSIAGQTMIPKVQSKKIAIAHLSKGIYLVQVYNLDQQLLQVHKLIKE